MSDCIYILTNEMYWNIVKIGFASDIHKRLKDLNNSTAVPVPFKCYAIYEVSKKNVDKTLHELIDMLNPMLRVRTSLNSKVREREFYSITKEDAYNILKKIAVISDTEKRLHYTDSDGNPIPIPSPSPSPNPSPNPNPNPNKSQFSFEKVGIPIGAELVFIKDSSVRPVVYDNKNKILYNNKIYTCSGLAQKLQNKNSLQGTCFFTYNGIRLSDMNY